MGKNQLILLKNYKRHLANGEKMKLSRDTDTFIIIAIHAIQRAKYKLHSTFTTVGHFCPMSNHNIHHKSERSIEVCLLHFEVV